MLLLQRLVLLYKSDLKALNKVWAFLWSLVKCVLVSNMTRRIG